MAQKENKKIFEVGDVVTTKLLRLSVKGKIDVVGRIKSINDSGFGIKEYLITQGKVEDFITRIVE